MNDKPNFVPKAEVRNWMDSSYYNSFALLNEVAQNFPTPSQVAPKTYPTNISKTKIEELKKLEIEAWKFAIVEALSYSKNPLVVQAYWDMLQRSHSPKLQDYLFERLGILPNLTASQYLVKCVDEIALHKERCISTLGFTGSKESATKLNQLIFENKDLKIKKLAIKALGAMLNPSRMNVNDRELNQGLMQADETFLKLILKEDLGGLEPSVIEAITLNQYRESINTKYAPELSKSQNPKVVARIKKILAVPGRMMPRKPVKSKY